MIDRAAFRSDLEQYVMHALPEDTLYEPVKLELTVQLRTIPDFFLPSDGIIVEAKGIVRNRYDELKAEAVKDALPLEVNGVTYRHYIMAVSCSNTQIRQYAAVNGDTAALKLKLPSNTMAGLDLCHWANLHGILAVPVSRDNLYWLERAIRKCKNRKVRNVTRTSRCTVMAQ